VAKAAKRPAGAPKYSDVSMRLFYKKKDGAELKAARAFHITRADWSYIKDAEYIKKVKSFGWTFQGSTNAVTRNPKHAMKDGKGKPVLDHFGKPGRFWADSRNRDYRDWYVRQLLEWVRLGADSVQRDEPTCCRRWPIRDSAAFFRDVHARFEKKLGRKFTMSCNLAWNRSLFGGRGEPVTKLFDYGMAEMGPRELKQGAAFFRKASLEARARGKFLVYTSHRNLGIPGYRRAIANCYAGGMLFIVPWDQFGGVGRKRVFAKPEDLADLYGFVRSCTSCLDGYEDAAVFGPGLKDGRWKRPPVSVDGGSGGLCAWTRAKPGKAGAPVVIHLTEWRRPKKAVVKLREKCLFAGGRLAARLLVPAAYDRAVHERAEKSGDYSGLRREVPVKVSSSAGVTSVEVPALRPWGILVVTAADNK
jgi:hypothetical protein